VQALSDSDTAHSRAKAQPLVGLLEEAEHAVVGLVGARGWWQGPGEVLQVGLTLSAVLGSDVAQPLAGLAVVVLQPVAETEQVFGGAIPIDRAGAVAAANTWSTGGREVRVLGEAVGRVIEVGRLGGFLLQLFDRGVIAGGAADRDGRGARSSRRLT
jgi:hypothetical protein